RRRLARRGLGLSAAALAAGLAPEAWAAPVSSMLVDSTLRASLSFAAGGGGGGGVLPPRGRRGEGGVWGTLRKQRGVAGRGGAGGGAGGFPGRRGDGYRPRPPGGAARGNGSGRVGRQERGGNSGSRGETAAGRARARRPHGRRHPGA